MNTQIRIIEPLGERAATLPLDLGGEGASLVLPGATGRALRILAGGRQWLAEPVAGATVTINGIALRAAQPLVDGDVIAIGAAHLVIRPSADRIEVLHLAGNETVAPLRQAMLPGDEVEAGVREVFAADTPDAPAVAVRPVSRRWRRVALGVAAVLVLAVTGVLLALVPVPLQVTPEQAQMSSPGLIHWRSGDRIFLLPGRRAVQISHPGYRPRTLTINVSRALAGATPLAVELEYLPGVIGLDTGGIEAQLLVDGRVAGEAPGDIEIPAGVHDLILRAPDHVDHVTRLQVEGGGRRQELAVRLEPSLGYLVLDTTPANAVIRIDGETYGEAPQRLELPAGLHEVVLSAPGGRSWRSEVAVIAGQTLDLGRVNLPRAPPPAPRPAPAAAGTTDEMLVQAQDEAAPSAPPPPPPAPRLSRPLIGALVLFPAGEYLQGSGRREQGRRSNETQRTVRLTRPFYLAATEVSNAQFRAFRATHVSGVAAGHSLDLDSQAVTNVTWNDAVEFCNWLSLREGLPAAYERRDGRWQLVQPLNNGYRLPTEAEWEYAARYVDGDRWQRFAWGDELPPPPGVANLAGEEVIPARPSRDALRAHLPQYRDEHPVIAPVDSYAPTPMGLYGMGGNVSEWMHDVYESLPAAGTVTDPMGPPANGPHAVRGQNWRTAGIGELRAAWRERGGNAAPDVGFRVARFAEETPAGETP